MQIHFSERDFNSSLQNFSTELQKTLLDVPIVHFQLDALFLVHAQVIFTYILAQKP